MEFAMSSPSRISLPQTAPEAYGERVALAWTEHLTRVSTDGAPDAAYDRLCGVFTQAEIANLTVLIGLINLWNRIGAGFRLAPATKP